MLKLKVEELKGQTFLLEHIVGNCSITYRLQYDVRLLMHHYHAFRMELLLQQNTKPRQGNCDHNRTAAITLQYFE